MPLPARPAMLVPVVAAALGLPSPGPAQAPPEPSLLADVGDPLELARRVDAAGDEPVLALLAEGTLEERLAAIRACRWLAEPERALAMLAPLASGDDPDLAPAAAQAASRIAERLRHDALRAREADLGLLDAAPWEALGADATARPDLRAIGDRVAAALRALAG